MPWTWDHENYIINAPEMVGFFYPEDFNTILQINSFESERKDKTK